MEDSERRKSRGDGDDVSNPDGAVSNGPVRERSEDDEEAEYVPSDGENSIDDEGTLEEEEALENDGDIDDEVAALQDEQDIPVEELLRLYGYGNTERTGEPSAQIRVEDGAGVSELSGEQENVDNSFSSPSSSSQYSSRHALPQQNAPSREDGRTNSEGDVRDQDGPSREHGYFSTSDEDSENDFDYVPDESWRKEIKVGPEHQAEVPDATCAAIDGTGSVDSLDECLWCPDPIRLSEESLEQYLRTAYRIQRSTEVKREAATPVGETDGASENGAAKGGDRKRKIDQLACDSDESSENLVPYLRDDESALKLLVESQYNLDASLVAWKTLLEQRRNGTTADMEKPWSEEEQNVFEEGLKAHGKGFRSIREEFLPHRSLGELVRYYYLWKRTERHDVFVQTYRFEKRHCSLHPTATDYMDHFLDHMALVGASSSAAPHPPSFVDGEYQQHRSHNNHHPALSIMAPTAHSRHGHKGHTDGGIGTAESSAVSDTIIQHSSSSSSSERTSKCSSFPL